MSGWQSAHLWAGELPALGLAVLLMVGAGLPAAIALGLRGLPAALCAPALTASVVGVGALGCSAGGWRWGAGPLAVSAVIATVLAGLLGLVSRSVERWLVRAQSLAEVARDGFRLQAVTAAAWGVGTLLVLAVIVPVIGQPQAYPQAYDSSFHVNVIRWMAQTGDAASTHAQAIVSGTGTGFYPAVFHALAATVVDLTGQSPIVAGNLMALVVSGPVWVAGCLLLARQMHGPRRLAIAITAVTATAFSFFPYQFLGHGVHWPNALGFALLPALLGAVVAVLGLARQDVLGRPAAVVLLLLAAPGLLLAHPNAAVALALLTYLVAATRMVPAALNAVAAGRRLMPAAVLAVLVLAPVTAVLATSVNPMLRGVASFDAKARLAPWQALGELLVLAPNGGWPAPAPALLCAVGIVALVRRRGPWWPLVSAAVLGMLYVFAVSVDSALSQALTGFWYNDPGRVAGLLPIVLVPLATLGAVSVSDRLRRAGWHRVLAAAVVVGFVLVDAGTGYPGNRDRALDAYVQRKQTQIYATPAEQRVLAEIAGALPADVVVASNPWNGSQLLYALTGRRVLFGHFKPALVGERLLVAQHADLASNDPQVCAALQALHVDYVLTSTAPIRYWPWNTRSQWYPGLDGVDATRGYTLVDHQGPYQLWRVPACNPTGVQMRSAAPA